MEYLYPVKPEMFRVIAGGQTIVILFEKYIVYKAILDKEQSMKKMAIAGNRILKNILNGNPDFEIKENIIGVQQSIMNDLLSDIRKVNIDPEDISRDIHSWGYVLAYCGIPFIRVDYKKDNERFDATNFFANLDSISKKCNEHIKRILDGSADYQTLKGLKFAIKLKKNMV